MTSAVCNIERVHCLQPPVTLPRSGEAGVVRAQGDGEASSLRAELDGPVMMLEASILVELCIR